MVALDVDDSKCFTADPGYQKRINERVKGKSAGNGEWTGSADDADMPDCNSYLVKTPRGYRSEMFVPAERLNGWSDVAAGKEIGFGFYLTVMDLKDSLHLLYWPNPKADNVMKKPWMWARVRLEQ